MTGTKKTLVVVVGPTASGKTLLAIDIAKYFGTEIISADSRQFYKEIPIGTAAPDQHQVKAIKHHFIGHLSITDEYNVSRFEHDVLSLLQQLFKKHKVVVMVGGSGLYIDAVCKGIDDLPDPDKKIRNELQEIYRLKGITALHQKLRTLDPEYFDKVDKNNPKRLIRAIEVCIQTGKTYTELRKNEARKRDFDIVKIGLDIPREELNKKIHHRTDKMIEYGFLNEAEFVYSKKNLNALNTVGYKELFSYMDGTITLDNAITKIKTNTRRFAKRQMTWFRRDETIRWFSPDKTDEIISYLNTRI